MKEVLDAIADGILIIDKDYDIVFANRAMLEICGILKKEDIIGKSRERVTGEQRKIKSHNQ